MEAVLSTLLVLGVGAWVGGFATVFVLSRSSQSTLAAPQRVSLFREFGRRYTVVAASAMALILLAAAILTYIDPSRTAALALLIVSIVIVAVSIPAVRQARQMAGLRRDALDNPRDDAKAEAVRRSARSANMLRGVLAAGSILLVVLVLLLGL
jgi:hypothetical protein